MEISSIGTHPRRKTGLRLPDAPALNDVIRFGDIATGVNVTPFAADYLTPLDGHWQMLGNDQYGDCEAVRWANHRYLLTTTLTDTPHYPSQDDVFAVYRTQNPGFPQQDDGMDTLALLDWLHKNGGPDGQRVVAYAAVNTRDLTEVQYAIDVFGAVWLDIIVLDGNQHQFDNGVPWTNDGSNVDGGHAVLAGGVPLGDSTRAVDIETWAAETALAPSFWNGSAGGHRLVQACYVVIWPENLSTHQFETGVDAQALIAAYAAVTGGKTLDIPTPAPAPVPTPSPVPQAGTVVDFTTDEYAALAVWAANPHVWKRATAAGKAWRAATGA